MQTRRIFEQSKIFEATDRDCPKSKAILRPLVKIKGESKLFCCISGMQWNVELPGSPACPFIRFYFPAHCTFYVQLQMTVFSQTQENDCLKVPQTVRIMILSSFKRFLSGTHCAFFLQVSIWYASRRPPPPKACCRGNEAMRPKVRRPYSRANFLRGLRTKNIQHIIRRPLHFWVKHALISNVF